MSGGPAPMREEDIRPKLLLDEFFVHLKRDADRLAANRSQFVHVPCPSCDSAFTTEAFDKDGFSYRSCVECASLFASPRPTVEQLVEYAESSEAVAYWSSHFYRETAAARRARIFRPRAARAVDVALRHGLSGAIAFADVGAGYGLFLSELRLVAPDWRLAAIEPDTRLAAICGEQGFRTVERWVEGIDEGEFALDFVSAFEVLEHVFDPCAFLAACRRLLKPGGLALVTTLTISGFDLLVLGSASRSITPPQHLNFPSVAGVQRLAVRAGFEVLDVATPGELDVDIVRNFLEAHPEANVPAFARTLAMADEATRQSFQAFLVAQRLSSHVRCVFRRPV
jgi:SAM-dependent methyltransferase